MIPFGSQQRWLGLLLFFNVFYMFCELGMLGNCWASQAFWIIYAMPWPQGLNGPRDLVRLWDKTGKRNDRNDRNDQTIRSN